ncbi:ABC transporter ATP-binding protein/permease [Flavobacteriaceae bacterium]|nr:ABC transporter ATP-binding protein/permease [Flavobacteriaceae bacterium]
MKSENPLYKIFQILTKEQRKRFYLILFCLFIGMILEAFGIGIILPVLNVIVSPENLKQIDWLNNFFISINLIEDQQIIVFSLGLLVGIYFFKSIYLVLLSFFQNRYISFISSEISNRLFKNYLNQDFMFHNDRNSSELIKMFQLEIYFVTLLMLSGITLITEIAIVIAIISTLLFVEPTGTTFIIIFFLIFGSLFYYFSKNKSTTWGLMREKADKDISKLITESLNGINEVFLLGKESFFQMRLIKYNTIKARINSNQVTLGQIPRYYLEFISIVSLVGFIMIMIINEKDLNDIISIGGVFIAATFRVLPSINRIISSLQQIKYYKSSVDIVSRDLNLEGLPIVDKKDQTKIPFQHKLQLDQVSFSYPKSESPIFENLNFELKYGEVVGIIGPSGVGKSTFTNLIVGFLSSFEGDFKVDGKRIDKSNATNWRKQLGYVSQSIYLIDDTIRANVAFGEEPDEIDDLRIEKAIKKAQLYNFIQGLPKKLDSIVGERGAQLSGGQQQRIGIARALYHEPKLLILDEATSALDEETEKEVMKAVEGLKGEMTILIITHRLSTLSCCDKIYKVDNKKLVEQ